MVLRYFILFLIFFFSFNNSFSQSKKIIDSLKNRLAIVENDSLKAGLLNELAFQLKQSDPINARDYAEEACLISTKLNLTSEKASCLVRLGIISIIELKYEEAEEHLNSALKERIKINKIPDVVSVYNTLGLLMFFQNENEQAIQYYEKGMELVEASPPSNVFAELYNNISNSYRELSEYKKAIEFINKGIEINKALSDEQAEANLLVTLGNWFTELENYPEAIKKFELAFDIYFANEEHYGVANCYTNIGNCHYHQGRYDEALKYLDAALAENEFLELSNIANVYRIKGNIYRHKNLSKKAFDAFQESLKRFKDIDDHSEMASLYYNIGLLNKDNSEYNLALGLFLKCQAILDTIVDPLLELSLCQEISETYLQLGNQDRAIEYILKHNYLQDSLESNYREAINYKLSFEEEKQKNELLESELKVNELLVQKKEAKMKSYIGLVVALFILMLLFFLYINSKRRAKHKINQKNQEIDKVLKDQAIKTTYAKLEGQDEERKRIAQELHDRVGSILSTVKLYFDGFDSKLDSMQSQNQENHFKANELLDEAVSEVRKIARNINSGTLTKFGLKAELEALSELLIESKKIDIEIITFGLEERLPVALEIKIYRIIQELVSNILKHAKATKINIQLNQFKDVINFIVQDNGIGFDPKKAEEKNGMGLKSIKSRVYNLHGSIIIDTGKGSGTTITIDIPRD